MQNTHPQRDEGDLQQGKSLSKHYSAAGCCCDSTNIGKHGEKLCATEGKCAEYGDYNAKFMAVKTADGRYLVIFIKFICF